MNEFRLMYLTEDQICRELGAGGRGKGWRGRRNVGFNLFFRGQVFVYNFMQKMGLAHYEIFLLVIFFMLGTGALGESGCPVQRTSGSIHSGTILAALNGGVLNLKQGEDILCYSYSLPNAFGRSPQVAVAVHDFDMDASNNIFFYVKPVLSESKTFLSFVIRSQWLYTHWIKLTFSFIAEDRTDLESGYYQLDSGPLTTCHNAMMIKVNLPIRTAFLNPAHQIFLHGFELSTVLINAYTSDKTRSPFDIQIGHSSINRNLITMQISVTSPTQINSIYLSYIVYERSLAFDYQSGSFVYDSSSHNTMMFRPAENVPRSYARIYGLTGFIIDHSYSERLSLTTRWDGNDFSFDFGRNYNAVKYFSFEYIFFTGSECASCPGHPLTSLTGQCVQICPRGSFKSPKEDYCITCGEGRMWNGTACLVSCSIGQYYNSMSKKCQCPPSMFWTGNNCIICTNGKIWMESLKSCDCPPGLRWNGYSCARLPECTGGRIWDVYTYSCKCLDHQYWNNTACKDIPKCIGGQILNQAYQCVCPNKYVWNGQECSFTPCFGGQIWTGSICTCPISQFFNGTQCLECINGQKWNSKNNICECEIGFKWNGNFCEKTYECNDGRVWNWELSQCHCYSHQFWNGYICVQTPSCRGGQIWDVSKMNCSCLPSHHWTGNECLECKSGKIWNDFSSRCVCPPGTVEQTGVCQVQQTCTGGKTWVQNTWSCECPLTTQWNGNYCIANPCSDGRVWNDTLKSCKCPNNLTWNNEACIPPQQSCSNGRMWDKSSYSCKCPVGTYPDSEQCSNIPVCAPPRIYSSLTNRCSCSFGLIDKGYECSQPQCHENQYWNGYECKVIQCPPPSFYFEREKKCVFNLEHCSFGSYWIGDSCQYFPSYCPKGTVWNGNECYSNGMCRKAGQYMADDGNCYFLSQICNPPLIWDGTNCILLENKTGRSLRFQCPEGTYLGQNAKCLPMMPCKNGHIWDEIYLKCSCPPQYFSNGNRCVQCPADKNWVPNYGCLCPEGKFDVGSTCEVIDAKKCILIENTMWDDYQCKCRPGFTKVGFQCLCFGTKANNFCDKCSHKSNSELNTRTNICECKKDYIDFNDQCVPSGKKIFSDSSKQCAVSSFYEYFNRVCLPCPVGCLSCNQRYRCKVCRPQFAFEPGTEQCLEFCGDGKKFTVECDDGNNEDGDGCSSDCLIEAGSLCRGGSPISPDFCQNQVPENITLQLTGQIRMKTSIILNVKLNYLPKELLLGPECKNNCENILTTELTQGDSSPLSITSAYLSGTKYSFSINIEFGRTSIGQFSIKVAINGFLIHRYFSSIKSIPMLSAEINPIYLAQVLSDTDFLS